MRIFLVNSAGKTELPAENGKHSLTLYNNYILLEADAQSDVRVETIYDDYIVVKEGVATVPIRWDKEEKSAVTIRCGGKTVKYQFQLECVSPISDEDIDNLLRFFSQIEDNFRYDKDYSVNDLFEAIRSDRVALIIEKRPYSGYDDQSLLRQIQETVPMVMDICSHPKQSLRTEEAILDVNLVKRVNTRTMDHLASHSEHWKARTLNGLIPNRLRADIFEDEINIYENLFFRMAVDDILKYIHRQAVSIEKTVEQNDNAIDWNAYGEELYDYKRMRFFAQLLPDYNIAERQTVNTTLRSLLEQWSHLERNYSTVEASQFYHSIDKKKHISRNIRPTNILKKDSRYNALYRLWCEIQRQVVQEHDDSMDVFGESGFVLNNCYSLYVTVLLLYVFKLLDCQTRSDSKFKITVDGIILVEAFFISDSMNYSVKTSVNEYGAIDIVLTFIEKVRYEYILPTDVSSYSEEIKRKIPHQAELKDGKIVFYAKPSDAEQRELKNLFHLSNSAKKGMNEAEKRSKDELDKIWRTQLEELFSSGKIRNSRTASLRINPQYAMMDNSEVDVERFTETVLDSVKDSVIFTFPYDISNYRKTIHADQLLYRLLNYGEKYQENDARRWGNYRVGILPIAQSEINSAQRLMKLISLNASRLQIQWTGDKAVCPVCGSRDCSKEGTNSWKCKNSECGVIFGITKHAEGCGENYEWTRPQIDVKIKDLDLDDTMGLMLKKEMVFDRLAITDFELEKQHDGQIRYIPVCPRCGKRRN